MVYHNSYQESLCETGDRPFMRVTNFCAKKTLVGARVRTRKLWKIVRKGEVKRIFTSFPCIVAADLR